MHIDTSRSRFDAAKHYSGVLHLQGRVTLDSDRNEQQAIWLHQLRTAITDVVGQAGVPRDAAGFAVDRTDLTGDKLADLSVSAGRIYVDGILVENTADTTYWSQPDGHFDRDVDRLPEDGSYLAYLRVWERAVGVEHDPDLREVALGIHGPDTTARSQVVWQVMAYAFGTGSPGEDAVATWRAALAASQHRGHMRARARIPDDAESNACSISPDAMFRGMENQHYRVEVFRSGQGGILETARTSGRRGNPGVEAAPTAQFVWSRNNGSDVYPIIALAGAEVTLSHLGRDRRTELDIGDLVEIVDDTSASLLGRDFDPAVARALFAVTAVDRLDQVITLDRDPVAEAREFGHDPDLHPLLRRWDGTSAEVVESGWLDIEDGVQVQFPGGGKEPARYLSGDFWLVPARRTTGDVIWPQNDQGPAALPPNGIDYHYAPLALVPAAAGEMVTDLRTTFEPLTG